MRSRAVYLPLACCLATAWSDAWSPISARSSSSWASRSANVSGAFWRIGGRTVSLDLGLVLAEDLAQRAADLAHRRPVLEGLADRGQEVVTSLGRLLELAQARAEELWIAVGLEGLQALELVALGRGIDAQDLLDVDRVLDELVDADDDVLLGPVALVVAEGRFLDLRLDECDRLDGAALLVDLLDQRPGPLLDLRGERFDVVGAGERVDGVGGAGLEGDDLLRAQGELGRALGRQRERLVEAVGVQGLRAAADRREPLQRDAHDVVHRLLGGERDAARLGVEAQHQRAGIGGAEAVLHRVRPHV